MWGKDANFRSRSGVAGLCVRLLLRFFTGLAKLKSKSTPVLATGSSAANSGGRESG